MPRPIAPVGLVWELWRSLWQRLQWWRFPLQWPPSRRLWLVKPRVLKLLLSPPPHLLPWRQEEWAMANRGPSRWRWVKKNHFRGAGQLNAPAPSPRGMSQNPTFPSPSRTVYEHAAVQPATPHNVAGRVIMHLHPDLLPQKAMSLRNQVSCMIAEYHLTTSARQSSLHPIIPEEAAPLLPPLKNYVPGVVFEGTRDVRVVDHAMALRVAVWLHRLNMAMGGGARASESLEASRHHLGPLLEFFLTPRTSNLTYKEVVDRMLRENHRASEESLHHLLGHRTHKQQVLDGLVKAHGELDKADKTTQKSLKKEIDQRRKSLEMLKERISHYEAQLG